jgi:hypothetical protein
VISDWPNRRGFCANCGSNLFWHAFGSPFISIWAGTIDGPTGLKMESQLYPESAGDYYELPNVPVVLQSELKDTVRWYEAADDEKG